MGFHLPPTDSSQRTRNLQNSSRSQNGRLGDINNAPVKKRHEAAEQRKVRKPRNDELAILSIRTLSSNRRIVVMIP